MLAQGLEIKLFRIDWMKFGDHQLCLSLKFELKQEKLLKLFLTCAMSTSNI